MKVTGIVLSTLAASVFIFGSVDSRADYAFSVDPTATWNGYVNAFELDNTSFATGFADATVVLRATFAEGSVPLSLQPNIRLYDSFWDGTNSTDLFWVNGDGTPNKVIEANFYQEIDGLDGQNVTFDWQTVANSLPVGYTAQAFIKVLDAGAGWGTVQSTFMDLTPGVGSLSLLENGTSVDPRIQAGFYVRGVAVSSTDPVALTGVTVVPEPTTFALAGIGALALLVFRRFRLLRLAS